MKAVNFLFLLLLTGFILSCSTIYDIELDYDLKTDFENYKSYNWMIIPEKADITSLDVERIKSAVNTELQNKGLRLNSMDPDFLIAEHFATEDKVQITNWGYGYGPYRRYRGRYYGHGGYSAYHYEEGSLIIDFIDSKSKKMIWRGVARAAIQAINTPKKKERLINEAVKKILERFPP